MGRPARVRCYGLVSAAAVLGFSVLCEVSRAGSPLYNQFPLPGAGAPVTRPNQSVLVYLGDNYPYEVTVDNALVKQLSGLTTLDGSNGAGGHDSTSPTDKATAGQHGQDGVDVTIVAVKHLVHVNLSASGGAGGWGGNAWNGYPKPTVGLDGQAGGNGGNGGRVIVIASKVTGSIWSNGGHGGAGGIGGGVYDSTQCYQGKRGSGGAGGNGGSNGGLYIQSCDASSISNLSIVGQGQRGGYTGETNAYVTPGVAGIPGNAGIWRDPGGFVNNRLGYQQDGGLPGAVWAYYSACNSSSQIPTQATAFGQNSTSTANPSMWQMYIFDADQDGLEDCSEAGYGTNPDDADSDNDGWIDGLEVHIGSDPLDSSDPGSGLIDADGDGLPDAMDPGLGDPDYDNDGIRDGWEVAIGTNPSSASSKPITGDMDSNGMVDSVDAVAIMNSFLLRGALPAPFCADVNRDKKVDNIDAILIFNYSVGNIPYLPYP